MQDLEIDTQLVHVAEPSADVLHLRGAIGRGNLTARGLVELGLLLRSDDGAHGADHLAVDDPALPGVASGALFDSDVGPVLAVRGVHEVPGMLGFYDVAIDINHGHFAGLPAAVCFPMRNP